MKRPEDSAEPPAGQGRESDESAAAEESAESAKDVCREAARLLGTPAGARTARALQRAGMLRLPSPALRLPEPLAGDSASDGAPDGGPAPGAPPRRPRPISIWQPRGAGAELVFVRPEPSPLGDHFAARREIRPKRSPLPLRVCLFGESAAAGYLYAPHLTPAGVLEAQLRAVASDGAAEVIDLARTNETLGSLAATLESAVQIHPDVVVVFAGNNWNLLETPEVSPYAPSITARQQYAEAWRQGGPAGPAALAAGQLREIAAAAIEHVARVAGAIGAPVILVVPEVSLAGWESRQPLAWLPDRQSGPVSVAAWYRSLARARRQLARGAWAAAAGTARAMLAGDGGGNPTSWRLLERSLVGAGDGAGAVAAARAEIDAAAYPTIAFLGAPQATSLALDVLRQAARRHGFAAVDLPEVFAAHTGSPLPGRRLFLDYCHLTAEGIQVAMAAVASEVLRLSGIAGAAGDLGWRELLGRLPPLPVPPQVEAVARLGAAVHGAHRLLAVGPKAPFLEAWCDAALAASPGIESAMLDLVAARSSPLPAVLSPAQGRALAADHRLGLPHGWRWDHVDAEVIAAILASLERHGRTAAHAEAAAMLLAGRRLRPAGTDLLASSLWEPLERFYPDVMSFTDLPRPGILRSPWPETAFCLVCDGGDDVELEITARLPLVPSPTPGEPYLPRGNRRPPRGYRRTSEAPEMPEMPEDTLAGHGNAAASIGRGRRGTVSLSLNGSPAGTLPLREIWSRGTVRLPRHLLRPGINRLALRWPAPAEDPRTAIAAALARLEEGIAADLHPVFGEIHSAVARRR